MAENVFILVVAPLLGNILAVIMLVSPLPAVLSVRKTKSVGVLNTLPYPLTALNCFGWIAYGLAINNAWVVPANLVGLCAGLYFSMQVLPYVDRKAQDRIIGLFLVGAAYFGVLGTLGVHNMNEDSMQQMWGIQSVVILLLYYAVPLSSMLQVIRSRDASSIYLPLAIAATVNGAMWTAYGLFGTHDFNLWLPNGVGTVLGIVQIVLRLLYGAKAQASTVPALDAPEYQRRGSGTGIHLLASFRRNHSWYWHAAPSPGSSGSHHLNGTLHADGPLHDPHKPSDSAGSTMNGQLAGTVEPVRKGIAQPVSEAPAGGGPMGLPPPLIIPQDSAESNVVIPAGTGVAQKKEGVMEVGMYEV